jgi:hypothetical protein
MLACWFAPMDIMAMELLGIANFVKEDANYAQLEIYRAVLDAKLIHKQVFITIDRYL